MATSTTRRPTAGTPAKAAVAAKPKPAPRRRAPSHADRVAAMQTDEMREFARQCECWWAEARDKHAENRAARYLAHDYYDHEQLSPEDKAVYEERGQAPVIFNLVHGAIDWMTGTERRTRIDWSLLPRGPEDESGAKAQEQLLKYVSDANRAGWARSRAFKDACISGVGFLEEFLRKDDSKERIGFGYEDWRFMWWDPYSREYDFSDARYLHRAKFVDLDRAIAMNPGFGEALKGVAVNSLDDEYMLLDEVDGMPAMFQMASSTTINRLRNRSSLGLIDQYARLRVRLIETWHYREQVSQKIKAEVADTMDLQGITFDANNGELAEKLDAGHISLTDSLTQRMHLAVWSPGLGLLSYRESPYHHNLYPFTPVWGYRHHRDGMPYGLVRGMQDAQDEYNKRRAKALHAASANRVLYEDDAIAQEDEDQFLDEVGRPDAAIKLASGGLNKVKIETGLDVSKQHVDFQLEAKEHVYEGSGITRENLGQNTNTISGRAILAKQQQGAVSTAELFDLYRLAIEISGQKEVALIRQAMTLPRKIRILGGNEGIEWLALNEPRFDPATGEVAFDNDMLNTLADFKVAEQDFRETLRMAMAESLFETIGKMPPEMGIQLLDLAIELTDLPNKREMIARIQKINGVAPAQEDPAAKAAADAAAQAQAEAQAAAAEEARGKARLTHAQADKAEAETTNVRLKGKADALQTAGIVAHAVPIAATADNLYEGARATPPQPVKPGVIPA